MEEKTTTTVEMTAEQLAEYEQMKAQKAEQEAKQKAKEDRETYKQLVNETVNAAVPRLIELSRQLAEVKQSIFKEFTAVLEMKKGVIPCKESKESGQRTHHFTNDDSSMRISLGVYVRDDYRDTVDDGVAIVKEQLELLAKDDESRALVSMVLKLLSRDAKGTLKASRIVQLRKTAEEIGNERILEGVAIIEESYQPSASKTFIRAEKKNEQGAWVNIPLGMTEA